MTLPLFSVNSFKPRARRGQRGTTMNRKTKLQEFDPSQRALVVNEALDKAGVISWGRATTIANEVSVSHATASGWLLGSLPRDSKALLRFSDKYDIDIHHWINGTPRSDGLSAEKIERLAFILKSYEEDSNVTLTPSQFSKLLVMLYQEEDKTEFLLNNVKLFLV